MTVYRIATANTGQSMFDAILGMTQNDQHENEREWLLKMSNPFFEQPILNSPYACPQRHWELDGDGQPTQQIIDERRKAEFISPIPKPKKRRSAAAQQQFIFDEGKGFSTVAQQYDPTPIINELRYYVNQWHSLPNPSQFDTLIGKAIQP